MKMEAFRKYRGMPFVKLGMRAEFTHSGQKGRIAGANSSANLNIIFDAQKHSENCHPNWMMKYFDDKGQLIKEYGG